MHCALDEKFFNEVNGRVEIIVLLFEVAFFAYTF